MATGTVGTDAHRLSYKALHFIRKDVTYLDAGTTPVHIGTVPAGSLIIKATSGANTSTIFNGTGNTVNIGTIGAPTGYGSALSLAAIAFVPTAGTAVNYITVDTPLYAVITSTAGPTAGVAQIIVSYIPPLA